MAKDFLFKKASIISNTFFCITASENKQLLSASYLRISVKQNSEVILKFNLMGKSCQIAKAQLRSPSVPTGHSWFISPFELCSLLLYQCHRYSLKMNLGLSLSPADCSHQYLSQKQRPPPEVLLISFLLGSFGSEHRIAP